MGEEDIFDPTSVSNGGWDQKLDHLLGLLSQIIGWQNEIEIETISFTYLNTTITYVDLRGIDCHTRSTFLTQHPSQIEVGIKR
jgi:hypothetical protein